jgi:PBSX family phage terminase large subunit
MKFKKTPKQYEQVRMFGGPAKHCMSYGGSRAAKTFGTVRTIVIRAAKVKSKHLIVRKHFNSVKRSIFMGTFPEVMRLSFPDLPYKENRSDFIHILPNGSEIWYCGLDNLKSAEKVLGTEFSTIFFNECSELDYSSMQIILSRLAEKNSLRNKVYYDMNPPSKSHWSYDVFIRKLSPLDLEPLSDPESYESLLMNPIDNLDNLDEEYLALLKSMPEKERERFLLGEFADDSDGQAYYAFDRDRHVKEFNQFRTPLMIGSDFNVAPTTSIIFQIVNGAMYVWDEVYLEVGDTYKLCDALKKKGMNGGDVYPDSTGKNRKTSGKSDFDILKENGFRIRTVHNPLQRDRVNNINRLLSADKLFIHPRCKKLINDLSKVQWKNGKLDEGPDKKLTHVSDCVGYPAWQLLPLNSVVKAVQIGKYR